MMNYFSNRKKWMAYLILLTFVFTCIVPTNLAGGNSAWADTETEVVGTSNIQFTMFDYGSKINLNSAESSDTDFRPIATYFNFRGNTGDNPTGPTPGISNVYDEDGFTRNHATVERVLDEDGYPVLDLTRQADGSNKPALATALSKEARSLAYLFKAGDHAVDVYVATNSLVQETSNNYYEYNSATSAADFNKESGAFTVYANSPERTYATTSYAGGPYGDFLPFNSSNGGTDIKGTNNTHYYHYEASEPNYWYGMTMEATFRQPENGTLNGSQMEFNFSGDDDVWVFIDDVLVLDLGGTHGIVTGSINFATGVINQHINWANDNGTTKKHHWDSTKTVECKAVYHTAACEAADPGHTSSCACPTHTCDEGNNCYIKSYSTDLKTCFDLAGKTPTGGWNTNQTTFADYSTHDIKFFYLERGSGAANCWLNFNIQPIETVDKTVTKVWNDDDNRDGLRTESITVQLLENGQPYDNGSENGRKTLSSGNDGIWQNEELMATWTHLPKYNVNGEEISYTVEEVNVPTGYTCDITTDSALNFIITNTHELELIDISGTKHWIDEDNKNNTRPESIKVNLTGMVDGQQVSTTSQAITVADDWQFAFTDLPKYHEGEVGKEINYVITEDYVEGYQTFYDSDSYDITNIYNDSPVLFMDLPVTKIWQDDDNKAGIRPGSIELQLKQNGVATGSAITLEPDADGNWQYTFEKLPRYDKDGKSYVYSVVEKAVEGYLSTVVARADSVTIYNKPYNGEVGTFTVSKTVDDPDNIAADNTRFGFELEVDATVKDGWTALLVHNKNKLEKEVTEAENAKATAESNFEEAKELFAGKAHVYSTGSAYLFVMDVTTPQAFEYAMIDENGTLYSKTTESAYDFWGTATEHTEKNEKVGLLAKFFEAIQELAKNFSALPNRGTVLNALFEGKGTDEIAVEFRQDDAQELLTSANALLKAENDVEAAKAALQDFNDNLPTTPSAIKLTMTPKNGGSIVKELKPEVTAGETNFFDATNKVYRIPFELAHGEEYKFSIEATTGASIKYQVTEIDTKGANETRVNNLVNTRTGIQMLTKEVEHALWAFTNIFKQQGGGGGGETGATIDRTVKKVWNDNNNPDRPSAITVNLLRNGEIHDTVTLDASNGWSYDWNGLENGPLWSVREVNVADGYTASVSRSGNTFIITNTLTTTSTIPDETIPDENVPTGSVEPGEPLDEPEIPLGDAPATGDTNNAAPFMALMLFAVAGLVITRRKFN